MAPTPDEDRAITVAAALSILSVDTSDTNLSEIDQAEQKLIEDIAETDAELAEEILHVLDGDIQADEMVELVSNDEFADLDDTTARIVVQALNEADEDVKEEFEDQVNIFEGVVDDYVPSGSAVDVGTRRTVVAVAAATTTAAAVAASSRPAPTSSGGGGGGGATTPGRRQRSA